MNKRTIQTKAEIVERERERELSFRGSKSIWKGCFFDNGKR